VTSQFLHGGWLHLIVNMLLGDSGGGGDVAYLAHIGGFAAGAALIRPFLTGRDPPRPPAPADPHGGWRVF
jgi:membrane associated rhomboid family serine protease